ncbi:MAG: hypothetical protein KJ952_07325, partial [Candidatus Omnitrophica bacterium]|nr:hypothetical protein [Candidatus Omnitrophota bacterium]
MSGIYNSLEERLSYAQEKSLAYPEFLELLLEDEYNNRRDNSYKKRFSKAKLPAYKTFEDFEHALFSEEWKKEWQYKSGLMGDVAVMGFPKATELATEGKYVV